MAKTGDEFVRKWGTSVSVYGDFTMAAHMRQCVQAFLISLGLNTLTHTLVFPPTHTFPSIDTPSPPVLCSR